MLVTNWRIWRIRSDFVIYNTAPESAFRNIFKFRERQSCRKSVLSSIKLSTVKLFFFFNMDSIFVIFHKWQFTVSLYSKPWYIPTVIIIYSTAREFVGCETRGKKGHTRMWAFSVRQAGRDLNIIGLLTRQGCLVVKDPPSAKGNLPKPRQSSSVGNITYMCSLHH